MSGGLEFGRVLFRSCAPPTTWESLSARHRGGCRRVEGGRPKGVSAVPTSRSGERRGGEERRCRGVWSSGVCSSDLARRRPLGSHSQRATAAGAGGWRAGGRSGSQRCQPLDRESVGEGKRGDVGGSGVRACALPILRAADHLGVTLSAPPRRVQEVGGRAAEVVLSGANL